MKLMNMLVAGALILLVSLPVFAGEPVFTGEDGNVAIGGYDVVAYFTRNEPTKGSPEYSVEWRGAEWHFANAEHRDRFGENPERYAPAYGGYCAFGAAKGKALASSPDYWMIEDGRLFLNLNEDIHGKWQDDRENHIRTADRNWPNLKWEDDSAGD